MTPILNPFILGYDVGVLYFTLMYRMSYNSLDKAMKRYIWGQYKHILLYDHGYPVAFVCLFGLLTLKFIFKNYVTEFNKT